MSGVLASLLFLLLPGAPALPDFEAVRAAHRPSDAWLLDRHGELLQQTRIDLQVQRLPWVPLEGISPALIRAVLQAEDRRFAEHSGVDARALAGAFLRWLRGGPARGASTLSMQTAALLDPELRAARGRRGLAQKLAQMRAAFALERRYSKAQILEVYLNRASFRGETQGIAAASQLLFGKAPAGLGAAEAAVLAALLPDPNAFPERIARRACAIADASGFGLRCEELQAVTAAAQHVARPLRHPELAPQLAAQLLVQAGARVVTTLDARLQRVAQDALREQLLALGPLNARDGAAVVVDNASGDLLAYVGSAGPHSTARFVDGARARRQAGSTLKPFLYGVALERRLLTAASLLDDSPLALETAAGLYIPQNYDRDFRGWVSARTALASSLNVPAVRALGLVGVEEFRDRLRAFGYDLVEEGSHYGFSLALGSPEVTLLEQVNAYRALLRGGLWSELRVRESDPRPAPRRVLGAEAAFVVADILADRASRAPAFGLESALATRGFAAVKTGTSVEMRDNWCIGGSARFTVGVWVGNFEGDAMRGVSGVSGAAPAWLALMNALHALGPEPAPAPPAGLRQAELRFEPPLEPPRREWFLAGSETRVVELGGAARTRPRILAPVDGARIALDPDIPLANQRILLRVRAADPQHVLRLDGELLGSAEPARHWLPTPGRHRLALGPAAADAPPLDEVHFEVRGAESVGSP